MSRPPKQGLDYFPLDTNFDDEIRLLEAEEGVDGFGILIHLLQRIYRNGYYAKWSEENQLLFAQDIGTNKEKIDSVVNTCFKRNLFSQDLYEKYKILTSHGIQIRYIHAVSRRKNVTLIREFALVNEDELNDNITLVDKNQVNGNINSKDDNDNPTKDSKGKDSKGKDSTKDKSDSKSDDPSEKYNEFAPTTSRGLDYEQIKELWNDRVPEALQIRTITDKRKRHLRARYKESDFALGDIINAIQEQPFLLGENDRGWVADFTWIIENQDHYTNILERKYKDAKFNGKTESEYIKEL